MFTKGIKSLYFVDVWLLLHILYHSFCASLSRISKLSLGGLSSNMPLADASSIIPIGVLTELKKIDTCVHSGRPCIGQRLNRHWVLEGNEEMEYEREYNEVNERGSNSICTVAEMSLGYF
ncbi:hypothetical protein V6N11_081926 [Hibiscus sabdariffa]|uniref:Uncharacterized protein n=1 Tax=Hibiscus sabdariffa TaxID=183260 RepID=A0ABR2Q833_9ROSI